MQTSVPRQVPVSGPTPVAFIYHDVYDGRGFSKLSNSWQRYSLARQLLRETGLLPPASTSIPGGAIADYPLIEVRPEMATEREILRVHSTDHLAHVRAGDARGSGFLDYGDTPAWTGVFRRAALAVGGTLLAARLVASGQFRRAFNPAGGLHHAHHDRAGGFCPFNDVVIAVRCLQEEFGYRRIAIVDLDGHHGDGTEALLYDEPVLTISMHRFDGRFYPKTGSPQDVGRGPGFGYNLNVPLERGTDDATYLRAFDRWVIPAVRRFLPHVLFVVVGADSHFADPLVRLGLTLEGYRHLAQRLASLSDEMCRGRMVAVAGGGYAPEHVARCWTVFLGTIANAWLPDDQRLAALLSADREVMTSHGPDSPARAPCKL
jgi:acetoin utilization protein AcuC